MSWVRGGTIDVHANRFGRLLKPTKWTSTTETWVRYVLLYSNVRSKNKIYWSCCSVYSTPYQRLHHGLLYCHVQQGDTVPECQGRSFPRLSMWELRLIAVLVCWFLFLFLLCFSDFPTVRVFVHKNWEMIRRLRPLLVLVFYFTASLYDIVSLSISNVYDMRSWSEVVLMLWISHQLNLIGNVTCTATTFQHCHFFLYIIKTLEPFASCYTW